MRPILRSEARSPDTVPESEEALVGEVRRFYEDHHEGIERARHDRRYFYAYLTRVRAFLPESRSGRRVHALH